MLAQSKRRVSALCLPCMAWAIVVQPVHALYPLDHPRLQTSPRTMVVSDVGGADVSGAESDPAKTDAQAVSRRADTVSWDGLKRLRSGARVRLSLSNGSQVDGHLVMAGDDAVVLDRNKVRKGPYAAPAGTSLRNALTFQRSEVLSAEEVKGWPLWAKVALWVGIGYVVAGGIAAAVLHS